MDDFYDDLSPYYDLIYKDWSAAVDEQGRQLADILAAEWPDANRLVDVTCGIGTQAIGLASHGFTVSGSDLSAAAIGRARQELDERDLDVNVSVADMLDAHAHHGSGFDVAISCDNSFAHLLNDAAISRALDQMLRCIKPGGGCLITMRDYAQEKRGRHMFRPYGIRVRDNHRFVIYQIWDFSMENPDIYDLSFVFVDEDLRSCGVTTHVMRSQCNAFSTERLMALMSQTGFEFVRRLDGRYFQPVIVGTRPA